MPDAMLTPEWTDVLDADQLAETGRRVVRIDGKQIAVFMDGGEVYACNNRCPHEGYPLVEGSQAGCVLTCNWHNWKFDLKSGETLVGGDRLRRYPAKIENGRVLLDLSPPSPESVAEAAISDLLACFDDHEYDRMAREIARIQKAGGDPLQALRATVADTHDKFEYGIGHAVAAGADWLALYDRFKDDPMRRLTAVLEPIAHLAWDTRRQQAFPYPTEVRAWDADAFAAAIEAEDEGTAIACVRGALRDGLGFDDICESLCRAALAHYQDFGHALIYVVKARNFAARLGPDVLEPVLLMLIRSLVYATREDLIPEFKAYAPALSGWTGGDAVPDPETLRSSGVARVLDAIGAGGGDPLALYDALAEAASWQMLHMDLSYSLAHDRPVQDNVGWLDFTHALTFANAVRRVCTDFPDLWPAGLLQIGCFLGRNAKYVDPNVDGDAWRVADPLGFVTASYEGALDHGQFEYIVAAHLVKLPAALEDEFRARPDAPWAGTAAAALNRFMNSPLKRKHPLRTANQALDIVAREG